MCTHRIPLHKCEKRPHYTRGGGVSGETYRVWRTDTAERNRDLVTDCMLKSVPVGTASKTVRWGCEANCTFSDDSSAVYVDMVQTYKLFCQSLAGWSAQCMRQLSGNSKHSESASMLCVNLVVTCSYIAAPCLTLYIFSQLVC